MSAARRLYKAAQRQHFTDNDDKSSENDHDDTTVTVTDHPSYMTPQDTGDDSHPTVLTRLMRQRRLQTTSQRLLVRC